MSSEVNARYQKSAKGKEAKSRYRSSEKGKRATKVYDALPTSKARRRMYRQTAEGKASLRKYCRSEKGKASNKRADNKARWLRQAFLSNVKLSEGCVNCGYNKFAYALDFDHVKEKGQKYMNVSVLAARKKPWIDILNEVAKCDVLCSNCHRERTLARRELVNQKEFQNA